MAEEGYQVVDNDDMRIQVGTKVILCDEFEGTVTEISDPDADYNDELQKPVMYCPKITVSVRVPSYDTTRITWLDYPDGPAEYTFMTDDLKVRTDA